MSSLPALCNICCIYLEHLLLKSTDPGRAEIPEERGGETRRKACGKEIKGGGRGEEGSRGGSFVQRKGEGGGSEDMTTDGTNCRAQLPLTQAQIPSTLTQVYLGVLDSFLSRDPDTIGSNDELDTMRLPQR